MRKQLGSEYGHASSIPTAWVFWAGSGQNIEKQNIESQNVKRKISKAGYQSRKISRSLNIEVAEYESNAQNIECAKYRKC